MLGRDLKEFLYAFNARNVEYLVIGAYALGVHAEPRATKDLDIWIRSGIENSRAVFQALADFGAPLGGLSSDDFLNKPTLIVQIGQPPFRIDILQSIEAVDFEEAWRDRVEALVDGEVPANVLSRDHLIRNKTAVGRLRDLADVEMLQGAAQVEKKDANKS